MGFHCHQGLFPTIGVGYMDSFFFSFFILVTVNFNILLKTGPGDTIPPTKATKEHWYKSLIPNNTKLHGGSTKIRKMIDHYYSIL